MSVLYREEQPYRDMAAFRLLVIVAALLGWGLVIWAGVLGRPIGQAELEPWLALAIGLPLGVLPLLAYARLSMITEVLTDRLRVNNGFSSRVEVAYADVAAIDVRADDIRGDYNTRNIGEVSNTRTAYVVDSYQGVQLTLKDGRLLLFGSRDPAALAAALRAAWGEETTAEPEKPARPHLSARF